MGLAITKRLLGVLQGAITLRSAPGEGSTFRVTIPTGTVDGVATLEPVLPPPAEEVASPPPEEPRVSGRVLVVDDRRDIRFLAQHFLSDAGADTFTAEDGQSGADMALAAEKEGTPFAVVVMDMQMPKMDGYSAARLLRSKGFRRPIIALTANAMKGDRDKCIQAGCNDYTTKPLDREHLVRLIAHYSRTARLEEFEEERQRRLRELERPTQI